MGLLHHAVAATLLAVALSPAGPATGMATARAAVATDAQRPELAYLRQVNRWRPPSDPQLVLLLMAQYANAGRHADGIAEFESLLERHAARLDAEQKALYLSALAGLRAGHASQVPLLGRIGWVRDTLALLDQARQLTSGETFVARWMSGVVRAQLPAFFGERAQALADLAWCEAHADRAPQPGWMREVYARLAPLRGAEVPTDVAAVGPRPVFTTPFSEDPVAGHSFSSQRIHEVVPGRVYLLSGFEFTEYAFVVSADRRELIAIDAGTRADSASAALSALRARVPSLPPLTTVLVTHAHWDHVGGQRYFRSLVPAPRFIGRDNYAGELARDALADPLTLRRFFGRDFDLGAVLEYRPDVAIGRPTQLVVGGTRVELLPTRGGETDDALLIHLPELQLLFVGDILMPYLGAPFAEEGSVDGLLAAIEQVHGLQPRLLLHGHEPLTRIFASTAMLDGLAVQVAWLRDAVLAAMRQGAERGALHAANLMPPTLEHSDSSVHLAYLLLRENVINRLFDQHSGYWQAGLHGLDSLTDADRGELLVDYLGLSDSAIAAAAERMITDGKHELAAETLRWAMHHRTGSARLEAVRRRAYLKLMEKYQEFNPFKFIVYAAQIDQPAPQMAAPEKSR